MHQRLWQVTKQNDQLKKGQLQPTDKKFSPIVSTTMQWQGKCAKKAQAEVPNEH